MQLSPEQFHTLFDRAAQPVLLVQDGVITQCSSRAEELIAPGSPIRELLPPDAVLQELIAAAPTVLPLRLRRCSRWRGPCCCFCPSATTTPAPVRFPAPHRPSPPR